MINASPSKSRSFCSEPRSYFVLAAFIVVGALLALPLFTGAASSPTTFNDENKLINKIDKSVSSRPNVTFPGFNFVAPAPFAGPVTLDTFASDCTTPKTVYNVQDTDLTVCAKFTNANPSWRVIWSNARGTAVQTSAITAPNSSASFTLSTSSSLGDWRVILFEPFGGTVQAVTTFTVVDAANPKADLTVSKGAISGTSSSGGQAIFSLQVTNNGPDAASAVQVSDDVPANTTFVSFDQLAGPVFNCTSPNAGETGSTVCTITSLGRGETAFFIATYQIGTVPNGTVISNTATVSSSTADVPNPDVDNNTSTATVDVLNTPCQLSTQENITVSVDTGQAGAVVTYATPTGTGDCGTTTTGENGESIPAISCNPASGSFFPVGTTTVLCTAQTGAAMTFQVTVDNPGALSISLNGAGTLTLECGQRFGDPGATAINGAGESIEITVSYTGGFDPDVPAVGSYTATYTATEDPNSVSTTRTFVVTYTATDGTHESTATRTVIVGTFSEDEVDQPATANVPPTLILNGDDQITLECGTAFTDPGATATVCGSPITVTTAGTVNPNAPGTYTINYSASANGFTSEATRIVTVQDTVAPVITLNGANPMTVGFGTVFTDPGATASDGCAGNLTSAIVVTGSVDTNTVGFYA